MNDLDASFVLGRKKNKPLKVTLDYFKGGSSHVITYTTQDDGTFLTQPGQGISGASVRADSATRNAIGSSAT